MVFEGYISRIVYQNAENGYAILAMEMTGENEGDETVVGVFPGVEKGDFLEITGEWISHPTYGPQIKVSSYQRKTPGDVLAIERYLASGAIKGIGEIMAGKIVKKFGEDSLRIIEEEPEKLAQIKGISLKKAQDIAAQAVEKKNMRDAIIFLQQYGITLNMAIKIYNHYGLEMYSIIRANPYKLATDIDGIGFKTADEIAGKVGIAVDYEFRVQAGLLYTLQQASGQGHTYLPKEELYREAGELLAVEIDSMSKGLMDLQMSRQVICKTVTKENGETVEQIYETRLYYMELNIATKLTELCLEDESGAMGIQRKMKVFEQEQKMQLDEQQKLAIQVAATHGLTIITGGPGTGKTTTINALIYCLEEMGVSVSLAAPTGRAAKRMTEATGHEAQTLHRLLEVTGNPEEGGGGIRFSRDEENPLDVDAVIVDETSMVDVYLMNALLKAIVPGTRLVLVGDVNQLPSVGPGNVLRDIIASQAFPVVSLQTIFRQAAMSDIVVNAHKINRGERVEQNPNSRDFLFVHRSDADHVIAATATLVRDKLPGYVHADMRDIQVLTPMRRGVLGVEKLNQVLQRAFNPPSPDKCEKETATGIFREGDKVMQIKNDYEKEWEVRGLHGMPVRTGVGVFNGDMGILRSINLYAEEAEVEFDENRMATYSFRELEELELAYAVTIHKSQGSEYPAVVLPLLSGPRPLMNRNLLYTAVTRAKTCVTIVGSMEVFQSMIDNETENKRYCGLKERIAEVLQ